jgi:arylsulfatase A-like enzyme
LGQLNGSFFEELIHVPLYIKLPNSERGGQTYTDQVELVDSLPTIIELPDVEKPPTVAGHSLLLKIREDQPGKEFVRATMGPNPAD